MMRRGGRSSLVVLIAFILLGSSQGWNAYHTARSYYTNGLAEGRATTPPPDLVGLQCPVHLFQIKPSSWSSKPFEQTIELCEKILAKEHQKGLSSPLETLRKPQCLKAWKLRETAIYALGKYETIIDDTRELLKLQGEKALEPEEVTLQALSYLALKEREKAKIWCAKIGSKSESYHHFTQSLILANEGEYHEALALLPDSPAKLPPLWRDPTQLTRLRCYLYRQTGDTLQLHRHLLDLALKAPTEIERGLAYIEATAIDPHRKREKKNALLKGLSQQTAYASLESYIHLMLYRLSPREEHLEKLRQSLEAPSLTLPSEILSIEHLLLRDAFWKRGDLVEAYWWYTQSREEDDGRESDFSKLDEIQKEILLLREWDQLTRATKARESAPTLPPPAREGGEVPFQLDKRERRSRQSFRELWGNVSNSDFWTLGELFGGKIERVEEERRSPSHPQEKRPSTPSAAPTNTKIEESDYLQALLKCAEYAHHTLKRDDMAQKLLERFPSEANAPSLLERGQRLKKLLQKSSQRE